MDFELTPTTSAHATALNCTDARSDPRYSLLLVCSLLIAHAPLAFNNGLYGDDWLIFKIKPDYQTMISFLLHGAGHPITYLYCALGNLSGNPTAFLNVLALAGIAIGALNLRSFLTRLGILSEFETLITVFLVWSYAGFRDWATKITAPYLFSFALLCVGLNLFAIVATSPRPRIGLRIASLAAIFCSFAINSMIVVFLVGLLVSFCLLAPAAVDDQPLTSRMARLALRFADYLALPIVYLVSINHFFPKIGPYRDYYLIRFPDFGSALSLLQQFLRWSSYEPALDGLHVAVQSNWLIGLSLLVGLSMVAIPALHGIADVPRDQKKLLDLAWPAVAGAALFILCALPYISVGIAPTGHFYESRHLLLFGLPLGLVVISALRLVQSASNRIAGYLFCLGVLSINICSLWNSYFFQQARWIRQSAMIQQLERDYRNPPAAVFNLIDGFLDYPGHTYYGITEITGGLHLAWDSRPLFGFTGRNERATILQEIDAAMQMDGAAFRNMDLRGPQATIQVRPQLPVLNNFELSLSYYRCLIHFCDWQTFADGVASTNILVGPIPNLVPIEQKAALELTGKDRFNRDTTRNVRRNE
ncbi:hypothetical protein [Bradyrhizobium lupini]|uniref:hypothetical protein n=1 Tax=Rhizobium lupini TaxID=136996 RepID=UPI0034C634B4